MCGHKDICPEFILEPKGGFTHPNNYVTFFGGKFLFVYIHVVMFFNVYMKYERNNQDLRGKNYN